MLAEELWNYEILAEFFTLIRAELEEYCVVL